MSCLLYNIAIESLAEMIKNLHSKNSESKKYKKKPYSHYLQMTYLYIWTKTAKFNKEKTEILPIESEKYRKQVIEKRQTNESEETKIPKEISIVKDRQTQRTLGSYIDNKIGGHESERVEGEVWKYARRKRSSYTY